MPYNPTPYPARFTLLVEPATSAAATPWENHAETFAAEAFAATESRPTDLREAWWSLLSLQFHDILAGTCVAQAQEEILHRFGSVLTTARDSALAAAARTARRVDTSGESGSVIFAANPLPWPRRALIQLDTFVRIHGRDEIVGLEAPDGSPVPFQCLHADANFGPWGLKWGKLTVAVDLPPMGHRVLRVLTRRVEEVTPDPLATASDTTNPQFSNGESVEVTSAIQPGPALPALPVSGLGELLAGPVGFVAVRDTGGTLGHGLRAYDEELGRPESLGHEVLEAGDLVNVTREKFRWGRSEIWLDVIRIASSPVAELRIRVNWQEHRQQLKLEIPSRLAATTTRARMPAEVATRPSDGSEFPCHDWVALEGELEGRPATLAVLNDSTYSYAAADGVLRFTLVRGVPHAEHPPFDYKDTRNVMFLDQGWQERRFGLLAFQGNWSASPIDRHAQEFQIPAIALLDSAHPGDLPRESDGISIEPASVSVLAITPTDEPPGLIVRLAESTGHPITARITTPSGTHSIPLAPWKIETAHLKTP